MTSRPGNGCISACGLSVDVEGVRAGVGVMHTEQVPLLATAWRLIRQGSTLARGEREPVVGGRVLQEEATGIAVILTDCGGETAGQVEPPRGGQGEGRAVWATTGRASTARMATTATTLNMRVDSPKGCLCPADSHTVEVKVLRLVRRPASGVRTSQLATCRHLQISGR